MHVTNSGATTLNFKRCSKASIFRRRFSKKILVNAIQFYSVGPEIPTIFTSGSRPREVWEPLLYAVNVHQSTRSWNFNTINGI